MNGDIRDMLCAAPDTQLDACIHPKIRAWSSPETALQVLEVLDDCVYGALASSFVIKTLEALLDMACKREGTTYEAVTKAAPWRAVPRQGEPAEKSNAE